MSGPSSRASLSTLCSRALFAVWHQTTLASKGRLVVLVGLYCSDKDAVVEVRTEHLMAEYVISD